MIGLASKYLLAAAGASLFCAACPVAAQQPGHDAELAEVMQRLSSYPPDIAAPTRDQLTRIAQEVQQLGTPRGNFFRVSAHENLLELLAETYGPDHPLIGQVLLGLARQKIETREYEIAGTLLNRAEAILAKRMEPSDPIQFYAAIARLAILDHRGAHQEYLAALDLLQKKITQAQLDDDTLDALVSEMRELAYYRIGRFDEAVQIGEARLRTRVNEHGWEAAGTQQALASQVNNLVAAGMLSQAQTLFDNHAALIALDEEQDRYLIARLLRAEAGLKEARWDFVGAHKLMSRAFDIYSAKAHRQIGLGNNPVNPDYTTTNAIRSALDMGRLAHRNKTRVGLGSGLAPMINMTINGGTYYGRTSSDYAPNGVIADRYEAQVARVHALRQQEYSTRADEAEVLLQALLVFTENGSGADSVAAARARLDLADNLLLQRKAFTAEEEARRALTILEKSLAQHHPLVARGRSIAALALVGQGQVNPALEAIKTALQGIEPNIQQSVGPFLALLVAQDRLLRLAGTLDESNRFWTKWIDPLNGIKVYDSLGLLEPFSRAMLSWVRVQTDAKSCPPEAIEQQLRQTNANFHITPPGGGKAFVPNELKPVALIYRQVLAETAFCKGGATAALEVLDQGDLQSIDIYTNETGAELVERYDRWARMMIVDEAFTSHPRVRELAFRWLWRAEAIAKSQIEFARSAGTDTDLQQRRVFASQGEGFAFRYALESRVAANWRYAQFIAQGGEDAVGTVGFDMHDGGFDAAFRAAQSLRLDRNSQARSLAAARAAAPNPQLREAVGRYQQLAEKLYTVAVNPGGDAAVEAQLKDEYAALDKRIQADFPEYYKFAAPKPVRALEAQNALGDDEGLLTIVPVGDDIYVFAISSLYPQNTAWHRVEYGKPLVKELVGLLRCDIDPEECGRGTGGATRGSSDADLSDYVGFDYNRNVAFELYELLVQPVAHVFEKQQQYGSRTGKIYAVTSGAISALPLSLLLTEAPTDDGFDSSGTILRDAPWLGNRFTFAYLPSVADLRAEPQGRSRDGGFAGYGDPLLSEPSAAGDGNKGGAMLFQASRGATRPLADPRALKSLESLPGAEAELDAIAGLFPGRSKLLTKAFATEPRVRSDAALSTAGVVLFSTHGVLPDPANGIAEPGLVMTPPEVATSDDDGLLSSSEAATLQLAADLLVLSACNTASAGNLAGADSLSGLARSFIFAGAGSVYASHWRVSDEITKELMVLAIDYAETDPTLSRSSALAKAMTAIRTGKREDGSEIESWNLDWAHPSSWAPFVAITARESLSES